MVMDIKGRIYDIQGFSVHDGPGIRTSVFLSGCPLSCLWCHNPEAIPFQYVLSYTAVKCIGVEKCGLCIPQCKFGAIETGEPSQLSPAKPKITPVKINRSKCMNCLECTKACRAKALIPSGKDMSLQEVFDKVMRDKDYMDGSGGGLTVSGGEALAQIDFTVALLRSAKEENIHTCLDTTGFAPWETLERTLPFVDLYLFDIKHMDSSAHKKYTGVPNERILENAKKLAQNGAKIQFRFPIIPGVNDGIENLMRTGEFIKEMGDAAVLLQILPYHKLGLPKYDRLGIANQLEDLESPKEEIMEEHKRLLERYVSNVQIH